MGINFNFTDPANDVNLPEAYARPESIQLFPKQKRAEVNYAIYASKAAADAGKSRYGNLVGRTVVNVPGTETVVDTDPDTGEDIVETTPAQNDYDDFFGAVDVDAGTKTPGDVLVTQAYLLLKARDVQLSKGVDVLEE